MAAPFDLTLVLDIGKSHAKLLFIDDAGRVLARHGRDNASVASPLGYPALDLDGLGAWITDTLRASPHTPHCGHAIASTHGAAFVALDDGGAVAWAPLDYEFDGVQAARIGTHDTGTSESFSDTLSPELPLGLNAARQLAWLQDTHPGAWARTRTLLPYPQYWAWWLSGVAASEASSLGCHTHLWRPAEGGFSTLARARGWADRFAPLRAAHEVLGPVSPAMARATGLPPQCQVHVGVHDSNACLARYLARWPAMTLVTSGTWTIVMAPGAPWQALKADDDQLGNVSVRGDVTPTARFMGGREYAALLGDAPPGAATPAAVAALVAQDLQARPAFSAQGGPFRRHAGSVLRAGVPLPDEAVRALDDTTRATLAAVYLAQMTAELVTRLGGAPPVVVEGPLAGNALALGVLARWLPSHPVLVSTDTLEGTARGAWMLAHWGRSGTGPAGVGAELQPVTPLEQPGLAEYHRLWRERLPA